MISKVRYSTIVYLTRANRLITIGRPKPHSMVLLTTTPRILDAVSRLSVDERSLFDALPKELDNPIEHRTVIAICRVLKETTLNSLLWGTRIYVTPLPKKPEPSPEYVALMDRLRKEQEERAYISLVDKNATETFQEAEKDDISPSLVLNILLSIVLCGVVTFHITRVWSNDGLRVLVSLFVSAIVAVAEVTIYAAYLRKVRHSREKERAKKEKKTFVGQYIGDGEKLLSPELDSKNIDKQEIWGRGINGGMRRRVREKWEKENARQDLPQNSSHQS